MVLPANIYNRIVFKCFDTCVVDLNNKQIDPNEVKCLEECASNLKKVPDNFSKGQMFSGFSGGKQQVGMFNS